MAEERKIKGFGAKAGGKKLSHIVCEDGGALCDKRLSGFEEVSTILTEVTCSKCSKYAVYKQLLGMFSIGDSLEEIKNVLEETDAVKKAKEKAAKEKAEKEKVTGKPETGAPKTSKKKPPAKKKEPVYPPKGPAEKKKVTKKKPTPPVQQREDWNLLWDEDKIKCDILHKPSQKVLFEGIKSSIALIALPGLNKMKVFWEPSEKIPKNFVPGIKTIIAKAYRKLGEDVPSALTEPAIADAKKGKPKPKVKPKPKRKIQRRVKAEKRVIKRRSPKPEKETKRVIKRRDKKKDVHIITEVFGRREGTIGFTVIELLDEGMALNLMVKTLMKKHSLKKSKAQSKIKAVIRKTARSKGIPIIVKMYQDPDNDVYGLAEDIQ